MQKKHYLLVESSIQYNDSLLATHLAIKSINLFSWKFGGYVHESTIQHFFPYIPVNEMHDALKTLCKMEMIKKDKKTDGYIILKDHLECDYYDLVDIDEIMRINSVSMLNLYICIIRSLDMRSKMDGKLKIVGHMTNEFFANQIGISLSNCNTLYKKLVDMKFIASRITYANGKSYHYYSIYEDANKLDKYLINRNIGYSKVNNSNWLRSVTQRYNTYLKDPSKVDVHQLYADCIKYNEHMDEKALTNPMGDYLAKKKDLTLLNLE